MTPSTRTFRIFVSSTFTDLKAERNALQEQVFPKLRALCQAHGCRFQAIDLRWGVSEEAGLDQQTMAICLGEVERCQAASPRPNFIILLGDRYGWQPLPAQIPSSEFACLVQATPAVADSLLLTKWYQEDVNSLPPVHLLQPRQDRLAEYADPSRWAAEEGRLRQVLQAASKALRLPSEGQYRYIASATDQEIDLGALKVGNANEHVFGYFRTIQGLPGDARSTGFLDLDSAGKPAADAHQRLEQLKARLTDNLPAHTHVYKARWKGEGPTLNHIEDLCRDVFNDLSVIISQEIARLEQTDPLEQEIAAHTAFAKERGRFFVGRQGLLGSIQAYIRSNERSPFIVHGEPGTGKSALLAHALALSQGSAPLIIHRFIAATAASTNGRMLLESLCQQIARGVGRPAASPPTEYRQLAAEFAHRLGLATAQRPLLIFLDALDQLQPADPARDLAWLPVELPPNAHLVISCLEGDLLINLKKRLPGKNFFKMEAMTGQEGTELLDLWLKDARRTLQPEQLRAVMAGFSGCPSPLYLRLAFEQARHWRSYDPAPPLGVDVPGIVRELFTWLGEEARHGKVLVRRALAFLGAARNGLSEAELLDVLSRDKKVMADFQRRSQKSLPEVNQLPVVIWSRLYFDLQPYLAERRADGQSLMVFYHAQVGEVVKQDYLGGENGCDIHRLLSLYFNEQPLELSSEPEAPKPEKRKASNQPPSRPPILSGNLRKLSELIFQQALSGDVFLPVQTLGTFAFLQAKVQYQGVNALVDDVRLANSSDLGDPDCVTGLRLLQQALSRAAHILARQPDQLRGQLTGRLVGNEHPFIEELIQQALKTPAPLWLRPLYASLSQGDASQQTLTTLPGNCSALALSSDGLQLATGTINGFLQLWNPAQGELIETLGENLGSIAALAFLSSDRYLACDTLGGMKIFDLAGGGEPRLLNRPGLRLIPLAEGWRLACDDQERFVFIDPASGVALPPLPETHAALPQVDRFTVFTRGDRHVVFDLARRKEALTRPLKGDTRSLAVTPDGTKVLEDTYEHFILWDLETGAELLRFPNKQFDISLAFSRDSSKAITAAGDANLRIWNLKTGKQMQLLSGHTRCIRALALSKDEHFIFSGGDDQVVKRWEIDLEQHGDALLGHKDEITALAASRDGRLVVSGSRDGALIVWNFHERRAIRRLQGHSGWVFAAGFSFDGSRVAAAATDGTARVWDTQTGEPRFCINDPTGTITCMTLTQGSLYDSGLLVTASKDLKLRVWNLESGELLQQLSGPKEAINAVVFSDSGDRLIAGGKGIELYVWDCYHWTLEKKITTMMLDTVRLVAGPNENEVIQISRVTGHFDIWDLESGEDYRSFMPEGRPQAAAVLPEGRWIFSAGDNRTVSVFDASSGQRLKAGRKYRQEGGSMGDVIFQSKEVHIFHGHAGNVNRLAAVYGEKYLLSAGEEGIIRVWDLEAALHPPPWHTRQVNRVTVSPDSRVGVSTSEDMTIKIWDMETGKLVLNLPGNTNELNTVGEVGFVGSDRFLISAIKTNWQKNVATTGVKSHPSQQVLLKVWNLTKGVLTSRLGVGGKIIEVVKLAVLADRLTVLYLTDERKLAAADVLKGFRYYVLDGIDQVVVSPKTWLAATASAGDTNVRLWNVKNGRQKGTLAQGQAVRKMAMNEAGDTLAVVRKDGSTQVWDIRRQRERCTLQGSESLQDALVLDAEGKTLVAVAQNGLLQAWEMASGRELAKFKLEWDSQSLVHYHLGLLLDGATALVLAGKRVLLWDFRSNQVTASLDFEAYLIDAMLTPAGDRILVGDMLGRVHVVGLWGGAGVKTNPRNVTSGPIRVAPTFTISQAASVELSGNSK